MEYQLFSNAYGLRIAENRVSDSLGYGKYWASVFCTIRMYSSSHTKIMVF